MPKNHARVEIDATKLTVEPVAKDDPAGVLVRGEDFTAAGELAMTLAPVTSRPQLRFAEIEQGALPPPL